MMLNSFLQSWTDLIDTELTRYFSQKDLSCNPLDRSMEYTLLAGGKRLRPLLTLATVHIFAGDMQAALPFSLASELLHTYSLIHDDLPCMDNDSVRRGKPTNHVIFGEAQALLAGDALHAEAFALLANSTHASFSDQRRLQAISEFAHAIGRRGMVAGQVMDITDLSEAADLDRIKLIHRRKTGSLLQFCVRLGGHLVGADETDMARLSVYAESVGLMFQVVDDLLDQESSSETLGKTAGKDLAADKATFPNLLGLSQSHAYADSLLADALTALDCLPTNPPLLAELAQFMRKRDH